MTKASEPGAELDARFERTVKKMLNTPPQPIKRKKGKPDKPGPPSKESRTSRNNSRN